MDLMIRKLPILLVAACAAMLAACGNTGVSQCEATGILCPAGFHCAAAEPVCITDLNLCGNAHVDPGEVCDDGNTKDGDNCASDCSSDLSCGNHIKDIHARIPEVCDDGNTKDGDGCSHDCLSEEKCGDKIVNVGEVCDDGNDIAGDGCSHQCQSNETCGNSIVDPGEACDKPGDLANCSVDCKSTLACDNGTVDPGEECDVRITDSGGNVILTNSNDSDCRADCTTNRCGDGFVNSNGGGPGHLEHKEECDAAPRAAQHSRSVLPTETSACNIDCTLPKCGDGKINRHFIPAGTTTPEQCDNVMVTGTTVMSLNNDNADCTAACQVNRCGDGKVNTVGPAHIEACDDGNVNDHDACTSECKAARCGDGILRTTADAMLGPAEECDDGNTDNNDGCSASCKVEFCGDNTTNNGNEQCDTGAVSTAMCNFNCKTPSCGDNIVNPLFKPDGMRGEQCDPPSVANGCSPTCRFEHCGNGVKDPGEQCDDGNSSDNDDCLSSNAAPTSCKLARCGDGKRNTRTEDCDDGNLNGTLASPNNCSATCKTIRCGNGVLEQGEQCDDGNNLDNDDCVSSNTSAATACKIATCGDGKVDARTEECDGAPVGGFPCSTDCHLQKCGNGIIDPNEECDDGMDNNNAADCRSDCIVNRCGDGHKNTMGTHAEACDGGPVAAAGSTIAIPTDTQMCNANCTVPACGDHIVNRAFTPMGATTAEQCDDGGTAVGDGCNAVCHFERCGNGITDPGEQCDDGDAIDGNGCDTNCTMSRCGNGIKAGSEECDDGNTNNNDGCTNLCKNPVCGDSFLRGGAELCDDGNTLACGTCSTDCNTFTPATAATALIFVAPGDKYAEMGTPDTFTLNDGITSQTFQFILSSGSAGTNKPIVFDDAQDSNQMAQRVANVINGSGLRIDAVQVGSTGIVALMNRQPSATGNAPITESVATADFFMSASMSGGKAGDCTNNTGCGRDADCASNHCDTATRKCTACANAAACSTNLCVSGQCRVCTQDGECSAGPPAQHCVSGVCQ